MDEIWIHSHYTVAKCWQSSESTGVLKNTSAGPRWIIAHAGGEPGFVYRAFLISKAKTKTGDYHVQMNSDNFMKWLTQQPISQWDWGSAKRGCSIDHRKRDVMVNHVKRIEANYAEIERLQDDAFCFIINTDNYIIINFWKNNKWILQLQFKLIMPSFLQAEIAVTATAKKMIQSTTTMTLC